MSLGRRINFKVVDDSCVSYGERLCEIKYSHGISPSEFVQIYEKLCTKYGLSITEEFLSCLYNKVFERDLTLKESEKLGSPHVNHLVRFILNVNYLAERCVNIKTLTREFNRRKNPDDFRHDCILSTIATICVYLGHKVGFQCRTKTKTGDFIVDGISADIKIISPPKSARFQIGEEFESSLGEDLCYDIGKVIENRLFEGIKQADLLFIDLAAKSLPFITLGGVNLNFPLINMQNIKIEDEYYVIMPELKRYRVIFFSIMQPVNLARHIEGKLPFSFYGTYIDVDPNLWLYLRESNKRIVHKKATGFLKNMKFIKS